MSCEYWIVHRSSCICWVHHKTIFNDFNAMVTGFRSFTFVFTSVRFGQVGHCVKTVVKWEDTHYWWYSDDFWRTLNFTVWEMFCYNWLILTGLLTTELLNFHVHQLTKSKYSKGGVKGQFSIPAKIVQWDIKEHEN